VKKNRLNISKNQLRLFAFVSVCLLVTGLWEIGILGVEVNPAAMHFINAVLFLSLMFGFRNNPNKSWSFVAIIGITIIYEIVRHLALMYSPIGIFHFVYYLLYLIIGISVYRIIKTKQLKPILNFTTPIYIILGLTSMALGHLQIFGKQWF